MTILANPRTWVAGEMVSAAMLNAEIRDQMQALLDARPVSVATTVANTTAETVVAAYTIPANQAQAGSIYRLVAAGPISFLANAQVTWRARIGGAGGTVLATMGPTSASSTAQSTKEFHVQLDARCAATGTGGLWFASFWEIRNWTQTGSAGEVQMNGSDGNITRDTTISNDLVITAQWAAASASNTLIARSITERFF